MNNQVANYYKFNRNCFVIIFTFISAGMNLSAPSLDKINEEIRVEILGPNVIGRLQVSEISHLNFALLVIIFINVLKVDRKLLWDNFDFIEVWQI